jgi:glycosyltransferase involved in cell wall biosynthesis
MVGLLSDFSPSNSGLSWGPDMPSAVPSFSVVVPVYNKAPCLERSIKSVLAQSFTDFELLLVDDGSTDDSLSEIRKFSDPRLRLLHRDVPGPGGYAARNLGIAESRADWVAFLDADDEWYPEHLEVLRALALESPGGVVATGWLLNYGDDELRRSTFSAFHASTTRKVLSFSEFLQEIADKRMPMWTGSVAARRELLNHVGGFPEQCRRGGDTATWLRLVNVAEELVVSTKPTTIYHRVDSFVTANISPEIMDNCVYQACAALLVQVSDRRLKRLLKRASNIHLSHALRKRARSGSLRFSECNVHYFLADWREHLLFRIQSLVPWRLQVGIRSRCLALKRTITARSRQGGAPPS